MGMISKLLFNDRAPKVLRKSIDFNMKKVALTASNIANSETPGFKASHMEFDSVLKSATSSGNGLAMTTTNGKHISPHNPDFSSLKPNISVDHAKGRIDGNNVDMEKEMTSLTEARINYDAEITAMMKRGGIIKSAIVETR